MKIPPALLEQWHLEHGSDPLRQPPRRRKRGPRGKRARALRRLRCAYCGGPGGTVDHFVPIALGGTDDPANLRPCCQACNNAKGDMSPAAWARAQRQR